MKKAPRLTRSIEMIHLFVVGSLHYWGVLIRSGLIYGFTDAAVNTISFLQEARYLSLTDADTERNVSNTGRKNIPFGKGLSFIWTGLLSVCLALLLVLYMGSVQSISVFLLVTSLTMFSLYHTFLVLAISLYVDNQESYRGELFYAYTLDYMIRNPFKSLFILMLTLSAMGIAYFNLVLFIFLVPSIYWLMVQKGLQVRS